MLEPIQGEAGVIPASTDFLQGLRELCDEFGLLLIFDEVQTGCGRTGNLFAYQGYGVEPDIMTLGKGLGGGVPISALLANKHCSCFEAGDQGSTYCGNPLVCAAGTAVINTLIESNFIGHCQQMGRLLEEGLRALSEDFGLGEVRGQGMLLALELKADIGPAIVEQARENGLLINSPRPHCLRFMSALNTCEEEIREGLRLLRNSIQAVLR